MRFTATENSQTGRPPAVMRSSGSRPTLPIIWIFDIDPTVLTPTSSFVPTDDEVAEDVLGELDRALELARGGGRERELDHGVLALTVVRELVGETAPHRGRDLLDLAAESADRLLEAVAHRGQALFVGGGLDEVHELVWTHVFAPPPLHGIAARPSRPPSGGEEGRPASGRKGAAPIRRGVRT